MGYVRVRGLLGNPRREKIVELDFLADTGAFYTTISPGLAKSVGIKAIVEDELMLADQRKMRLGFHLLMSSSLIGRGLSKWR